MILIALFMLGICSGKDFEPKIDSSSKSELFEIAHEIEVLAPSHFPKPTRMYNNSAVVPVVEPTFGKHRQEQDVVMVSRRRDVLIFVTRFS
jgi:hypothetical protein